MLRRLSCFACFLAACGGSGGGSAAPQLQALKLSVKVLDKAVSGQPVPILVSVLRGTARVEDYVGVVTFESPHPAARYPATYRFIPQDRGERAFATGFFLPGGVHVLTVSGEGIDEPVKLGISVEPRSANPTNYVPPPVPLPPGPVQYFSLHQAVWGAGSYDHALGDLDGDGDPDLAVSGGAEAGCALDLWLNDGSGKFTKTSQISSAAAYKVICADVDGDGDNDLAALVAGGETWHAHILLNDGDGTFTDSANLGRASEFAFGEFTGDGYPDLVVVDAPFDVVVRANDGKGGFGTVLQSLGVYVIARPGIADLDGDGDLDICTAGDIWRNNGKGAFTPTGQQIAGGMGIAAEDLDGDGDLDLAVGNYMAANYVYLNDGNGMFTKSDGWQTGAYCTGDVAALDLDEDGDFDLLEGNLTTSIIVWLNQAAQFAKSDELTKQIVGSTVRFGVGDLDGDGDSDFVTLSGGWLNIYRND